MKIAVLIPSRGLIFTKTIETVLANLRKYDFEFVLVTGKPIPDAQNELVEKGLETDSTHFLFVEDDMELPEGVVEKMVEADKDVVCVDYPVINGWSTIKKVNSRVEHCGLGCLLVRREVIEKLKKPWFRTDQSIDAETGEVLDIPNKYGGHDILFCRSVRLAGFEITQLGRYECSHLRCADLNRKETNSACYEINRLPGVSRYQGGEQG